MIEVEKPYTPEEMLELLSLKKLDAVYALAATVMNDGLPLGVKVGRLWRFDRDRVRRYLRGELDRNVEPRATTPKQNELLRGTKSLIKRRSA